MSCVTNKCPWYPDASCVVYTGSNLLCSSIKTNDRLDVILAKIDAALCSAGGGAGAIFIEGGVGIDIDGVGTSGNPYIISSTLQANNGLAFYTPTLLRLGQTIGQAGNPAAFLTNTEIPLGDYNLVFNNKTGTGATASFITLSGNNSLGYSYSTVGLQATDSTTIDMSVNNTAGSMSINYEGSLNVFQGSSGYSLSGSGGYFFLSDMRGNTTHSTVQVGGTDSQIWGVSGDTTIGLFGTKHTGFGGIANPIAFVDIAASTLTENSFVIREGVDPTSNYVDGGAWRTNAHFYMRLGGVTKQLDNDYNFTPDSFIQNQFASAQNLANFWIDGHGRIDDYLQINDSGRLVDDSGILSVATSTGLSAGGRFRTARLDFYDSSGATSASYINAAQGDFIDIHSSSQINFHSPSLTIDQHTLFNLGGAFPLVFFGSNSDSIYTGPTSTFIDLWHNCPVPGANDNAKRSRLAFSVNRTSGGKTPLASIGVFMEDYSNTLYKGDLVFETVDATVNTGTPTEYMRLKYDGRLIVKSLDTDGTAPTTTGTTKMVVSDSDGLLSFADIPSGGGGSSALSAITAAVATNTINNTNFAQEWQWPTLSSGTGLKLSSTSTLATSGTQKLFQVALSGGNVNPSQTTYAVHVSNTHGGTGASSFGIYTEQSSTAGSALYANALGGGTGITGTSVSGIGIHATSTSSLALFATTSIGSAAIIRASASAGTASQNVLTVDNSLGTYNTTAGDVTSTIGNFSASATRSSGANNLINRAIYANAISGQVNYSAFFDNGDIVMNTLSNFSNQNRLIGQYSVDKTLGFITIGSGLSLTAGVLSATGGGGGDTNFANTDLTASASRTHDWANFDLTINNIDDLSFTAVTSATITCANILLPSITNLSTQDRILGQFSTGGRIGYITVGSGLDLTSGTLSVVSAGGSVTDFLAGTLPPLFTTSVATSTTTPALSFALSNAAANTWFGNNTGGATTPSYNTAGTFSKTDDTNVTVTLTGTPAGSVLNNLGITLGWTGTLGVARGGTNISSYAVGDLIYASGATTLSKLVIGTAGQLLRVNAGATAVEYFTPTYISSAVTTLNTLTAAVQTFAVGSTGTDFNISSVTSTHTFNIPSASLTARGLVTTSAQSFEGVKTFNVGVVINESGAASDFRVETDGNTDAIHVDGTNNRVGVFTAAPAYPVDITGNTRILSGGLGIGTAPSAAAPLVIGGSGWTSSGIILLPSISATAGSSPSIVGVTGTIIEAGSGTHPIISAINISAPTITAGLATVTDAATVYISGPPTATTTSGTTHSVLIPTGSVSVGGTLILGTNTVYSAGGYSLIVRNTASGRLETVEPDVVTISSQSGTAYTLALTDKGGMVTMTNAGANTVTVPTNASVAFSIGTQIIIHQEGAGQTTVSPAVGVTINAADGATKLRVQYSVATLIKKATNTWVFSGDISI